MATRQSTANPPVTLTPEALKQVIADAIAAHEASKAQQAKGDASAEMDKVCIRAFRKAGYGEVKPRQDVKTYNLWLAEGLKVKEGERSTKVRNLRLFHRSQCRSLTAEEKAQQGQSEPAKAAAKVTAKAPKVISQGSGSLQ